MCGECNWPLENSSNDFFMNQIICHKCQHKVMHECVKACGGLTPLHYTGCDNPKADECSWHDLADEIIHIFKTSNDFKGKMANEAR